MKNANKNGICALVKASIILLILFYLPEASTQTIFKVPKYPYETCIADYDQDGDNDIIVGCNGPNQNPDSIIIFFNDGWGNFETSKFQIPNQIELHCEDLNGDNFPDLITQTIENIVFYENNNNGGIGDGHFVMDLGCHPKIGGIADINIDFNNDIIYYCGFNPYNWGVLFNVGNSSFIDSTFIVSSDNYIHPFIGNLNADSKPDLLLTTINAEDSNYVLYNDYPSFNRLNISSATWRPGFLLRINNDDLDDIVLFKSFYFDSSRFIPFINNSGDFRPCDTVYFINGTNINTIGDYNLDGFDDFVMTVYQANGTPVEDSAYIYFNNQQCGLTHAQSIYIGNYFNLATISSGDLNGNGYPDLVIRGYSMPTPDHIRVLWNDGTGHFVDTNTVYVYQNEEQINNEISVFPVPSSGNINIKSYSNPISAVYLYNLNGILLLQLPITLPQKNISINLNKKEISTGIYFCQIILENGNTMLKKVIINKHDLP